MPSEVPKPSETLPKTYIYEENILQYFWTPLLRF